MPRKFNTPTTTNTIFDSTHKKCLFGFNQKEILVQLESQIRRLFKCLYTI